MIQQQRKPWHDTFIREKRYKEGDWALLYDSKFKDFKAKLRTIWLGPYYIDTCYENGSVKIKTIDTKKNPMLINGHRLKIYKKPLSKDEFVKYLQEKELSLVESNNAPTLL